jgi:hypothetical protein
VDAGNHRVRKITADGIITTVAGGGTEPVRAGASALSVNLDPHSVTLDGEGNLFMTADGDEVLEVYGVAAPPPPAASPVSATESEAAGPAGAGMGSRVPAEPGLRGLPDEAAPAEGRAP